MSNGNTYFKNTEKGVKNNSVIFYKLTTLRENNFSIHFTNLYVLEDWHEREINVPKISLRVILCVWILINWYWNFYFTIVLNFEISD